MKKVLLSSLMAMFLFVGLTSMMSPPGNVYTGCQDDCAVLVAAGIFSTQGACMSTCNACNTPQGGSYAGPGTASGNIQVNHIICECKIFKDGAFGAPTWADLGVTNMGECIALVRTFHGL